jgi:hypothetical protein
MVLEKLARALKVATSAIIGVTTYAHASLAKSVRYEATLGKVSFALQARERGGVVNRP